ncbi:hypothetical protein [Methylobacterium persicinum]|uniref:Transposase n=1 Tax=Methylobacterium persicinum TaxID=374426 RepID=A0ABU0HPF5_9HYPH|nr:hypothetical protein [Methylobacterium persicinum]MDQ0444204.1 hypothetical protein [Methylobacterium persicinum]GJE39590.1 hypothetical protein KHHGKMAE_3674 [Methylobacterium persicinum]
MSSLVEAAPSLANGFAERRAIARANANWFRKLAIRALRDGWPGSAQRAANARKAARLVLAQARREAMVQRMIESSVLPAS